MDEIKVDETSVQETYFPSQIRTLYRKIPLSAPQTLIELQCRSLDSESDDSEWIELIEIC